MLNFTLNGALRNACTRSLKEWPQLDQPPGAGATRLTPEHNSSCSPLTAQSSDPVPQFDVVTIDTLPGGIDGLACILAEQIDRVLYSGQATG